MFNQAPFLNEYSKSVAGNNANMNRLLNSPPSQSWEQLNEYENTHNANGLSMNGVENTSRLTGFSERLQGAMDMNPRTINEKIVAERKAYNEYMLRNSGVNNSVQESKLVEPYEQPQQIVRKQYDEPIKEGFDVKMKGRCGMLEIIIIVFVIIAIFVFVNMYVSQKRMELMLHYYGKYMKHIQKKNIE
jgi:hypothetical protein